ncbi:hypothetical protein BOO86_01245 [Mycobacterium sp. CBMA 234]|uniref:hypothetical protein n=1 Tax=Mycolicibacterium sp. CBMA 234 TaxID=1918495 RepID=UPI0012DCCF8F|nr:hypothetical protein [Mycolicibacterium sp. CBMA 234]MUL63074.1 hypothetical protein [Mycolicibacterium sp. CBMA 234]
MAGPLHRVYVCDDPLTRGQARRLCRRFGTVGVEIEPGRLQQIAAGAATVGDEHIDVAFAMVAITYASEVHHSKLTQMRRQMNHWLLVGAMIVLSLGMLIALAMAMLSMMQPTFTGG